MKNIHCFLLIVMLLATKAHTVSCQLDRLDEIISGVQDILNHTVVDKQVSNPNPNNQQTCMCNFFCLSQKSLSAVKDSEVPGIEELRRTIKQYIRQKNESTVCTPRNSKYPLKDLLKDIKHCAIIRQSSDC